MQWLLFGPEIFYFLAVITFFCLSMGATVNVRRDFLAALILAGAGVIITIAGMGGEGMLFRSVYQIDLYSQVFKVMLAIGLFLVVFICADLNGIAAKHHADFYALLFTCTLAMMLLVSSVHILSVYVALELSSYSLYILVSLRRDRTAGIEAGLKYFLVGVIASAVMLFGMALLYGATNAVFIREITTVLPDVIDQPAAIIGLVLTLCGFFFKLAVFPFHFWAPDIYQGAANQAAAYIATASKVAAMAILMRFVALAGGNSVYLAHVLVTLAIISMTIGNLVAIVQKDFKRLLAYSSVAHAGYVLIGILSMNPDGYAATIYYAVAVLFMKFTCFLVLVQLANDGGNLSVDQLAGLHRRSPLLAMALMLAVFGLAGIPPTIGFTGKLLIFTAALENGLLALVIIAMINVVISLYYYLLVVKAAYLLEPAQPQPALHITASVKLLTLAMVTVIVLAGIYPQPLIDLAGSAAGYLK